MSSHTTECLLFLCCLKFNLLDFRHFNLRMKRDTTLFAQDLKVDVSGEEIPFDTSHIYTGEIFGKAVHQIFNKLVFTCLLFYVCLVRECLIFL